MATRSPPVLPISVTPPNSQKQSEGKAEDNVYPSDPYNGITNSQSIKTPVVVSEETTSFECGGRSNRITIKSEDSIDGMVLFYSLKLTSKQRRLKLESSSFFLGVEEFPWTLAIRYKQKIICGASLITPSVAITSAHCIQW